jgi:UPF0755 protein
MAEHESEATKKIQNSGFPCSRFHSAEISGGRTVLRRPLLIISAAIILLGLAASAIWLQRELETPYFNAQSGEIYIEIPRGTKLKEITERLNENGILRSRLPFILYIRFANLGRQIQAGEYRFHKPATPEQVAKRLIRGDVYYRSVTIPEGLTASETISLLVKNGLGKPADFKKALLKTSWIADIYPNAKSLEGFLFPETYRFTRKDDSEKIIKTMVNQFRSKLTRILQQTPQRSGLSIAKTVIMASMIEKEVKKPEEGPLVASVFINRMKRGIPLACDATIVYALKTAGIYNGNIRKTDLAIESPYNSYIHPDLPPGPISNPGTVSLRAAFNPANTDYLYYVSRNDGTHQFSKDYRSHMNAVAKYQKSRHR